MYTKMRSERKGRSQFAKCQMHILAHEENSGLSGAQIFLTFEWEMCLSFERLAKFFFHIDGSIFFPFLSSYRNQRN